MLATCVTARRKVPLPIITVLILISLYLLKLMHQIYLSNLEGHVGRPDPTESDRSDLVGLVGFGRTWSDLVGLLGRTGRIWSAQVGPWCWGGPLQGPSNWVTPYKIELDA